MSVEFRNLGASPVLQASTRPIAHASFAAAFEVLQGAAKLGPGIVLLTGAAGTGKTTLVHEVGEWLKRDGYCVGEVENSRVDPEDLLRLVSFAFGLKAHAFSKAQLMSELKDRLAAMCTKGRPAILILDEAQDLATGTLPELCQLGEFDPGENLSLQILLVGRDRVWQLLDRPDHAPVRKRIIASHRLFPLSLEDTRSYIAQSLEGLGWTGDPAITGNAVRLVHARTGGVPRLISLTLGHLLLHSRGLGVRVLDTQDVEAVLANLGEDHPELAVVSTRDLPQADGMSRPLQLTRNGRALPQDKAQGYGSLPTGPRERGGPVETDAPRTLNPGGRYLAWGLAGLTGAVLAASYLAFNFAPDGQDRALTSGSGEVAAAKVSEIFAVQRAAPLPSELSEWVGKALLAPSPGVALEHPAPGQDGAGPGDATLDIGEFEPTEAVALGPADGSKSTSAPGGAELAEDAAPVPQAPSPEEVGALLAQAEAALARNRLMTPASDSAYRYYRDVLSVDPANEQAKAGIQRIVARYREFAQQSLKKGRRGDARLYASRGLKLAPKDRHLLAIQRRASRSRVAKPKGEVPEVVASEEAATDVFQRINTWLRSGRSDTNHFLDH